MSVRQIGVVGPGVVGAPMAALLARAAASGAYGPDASVTVVQRDSPSSGWKVAAINAGRSPIGGVEPGLDEIVAATRASGHLSATHDMGDLADADVVLVCVQTDKRGMGPDYRPLFGALDQLVAAFRRRERAEPPLVVLESTLAPSSTHTVVAERFGDVPVRLAHSPNRVMPGRLVERVAAADKLIGAGDAQKTAEVAALYAPIVVDGVLHQTTATTAEVVKTLENTWRDVRIALAAEVLRACDARGVDFYRLREAVNAELGRADAASFDGGAVPSGAMLMPLVGVGGHCLPKDGILLRWRYDGVDPARAARSLIHCARDINDAAPAYALARAEARFGRARSVGLLGAAYRADSDDCRNSPALALALQIRARGDRVVLHDPYVRPEDAHVARAGLADVLTTDLDAALATDLVLVCQAHAPYREGLRPDGVFDAANVDGDLPGLGRGGERPDASWIEATVAAHRAVSTGFSNEVAAVVAELSARGLTDGPVDFDHVRALAATCATGCDLPPAGPVDGSRITSFESRLVALAQRGG